MRFRLLAPLAVFSVMAAGCSSAADDPGWRFSPGGADGGDESAVLDGSGEESMPVEAAPSDSADEAQAPDADGSEPCPQGVTCVTSFPFGEDRDSSQEPAGVFDSYACSPETDEGGPEVVYRVTVPASGFLSAAVRESDGVDVDVHILSARDAAACVDRGNYDARADVTAGQWWVIVDTYSSNGVPQSGPFHVDIGFVEPSQGPCDMQTGEMARVNDNGVHLAMPATGPMVLEAHLVTQEEPAPYPSTSTDELAEHYALSQSRTGFVMHRSQDWAPLEGGSFYGCGIGSPDDFPVVDEGWYVNMYWTASARPAKGTRMILREPGGSRAVVVAAGYETGPGDLSSVGGTPEESHFYMGTGHLSDMTLGIAVDQSLPLGPRECQ